MGTSILLLNIFLPILLLFSAFSSLTNIAYAAPFEIFNKCTSYAVWAAAIPGGGQKLDPDQAWRINVPAGTKQARIWGRTNCNFDGSGRGSCQTGDCNGLLQCNGYGVPPNTLAEYALNQCPANISSQCPNELRAPGGYCNNPCTVFKTDEYCCAVGQRRSQGSSRKGARMLIDPKDDATSLFTCPGGTNYRVVFCP